MTARFNSRASQILGAFSDLPLCAPDPLAEFAERARQVLRAPIAALWRGDFSPGQLQLERTWNLSAVEAITLWEEIEPALTVDTPTALDLTESPWSYRSSAAKRISSLLYLPIMTTQRMLGAFLFARPALDTEAFDRDHLLGLRLPLQAVAFALDNERLSAKADVMTQRLELLTSALPVPVCFLDANWTLLQANAAFKTLTGMAGESPLNSETPASVWQRLRPQIVNAEEVEARVEKLKANPAQGLNLEVEFAGDEERHFRLLGIPFMDKQDTFTGGALIGFDISHERRWMRLQQESIDLLDAMVQERTRELHEANEQLQQQNIELMRLDELKTNFMSTISHELRTPLNQIMGYGSMLQEGVTGPLTKQQSDYVDQIMEGSRKVLKLVNTILDLTRIDAGRLTLRPEWVNYPEFLSNVVSTHAAQIQAKQLQITLELADDISTLWFSAEEIEMVVSNLIGNAVKFTSPGGRITVRAYREGDGFVTEVRDTGIGISPEDQERIFERFVQVDSSLTRGYDGSGLGLAIAKQLVELHGGVISVESELGKGACFKVWLGQPTEVDAGTTLPNLP